MTSEHDAGVATQSSGTSTYTDTADTQPGGTGETLRATASTAADQGRRMADKPRPRPRTSPRRQPGRPAA